MGRTLTTWQGRARTLLGNPPVSKLSVTDLEDHVRAAIRKFSADRPYIVSSDYAGNGTTFDLAIPGLWIPGFSAVEALEYPLGQRPAVKIDEDEVTLYPEQSAPTSLRLNFTTPTVGTTIRIYYSTAWPIPTGDAAVDKISDSDFEPVAGLAASKAARQLAANAAGTTESTLAQADAVDFGGETGRWLRLEDKYKREYEDHVGSAGSPAPASEVFDWDARATWANSGRFLFRPPGR